MSITLHRQRPFVYSPNETWICLDSPGAADHPTGNKRFTKGEGTRCNALSRGEAHRYLPRATRNHRARTVRSVQRGTAPRPPTFRRSMQMLVRAERQTPLPCLRFHLRRYARRRITYRDRHRRKRRRRRDPKNPSDPATLTLLCSRVFGFLAPSEARCCLSEGPLGPGASALLGLASPPKGATPCSRVHRSGLLPARASGGRAPYRACQAPSRI